jgi:5'-3' exonuclease
MGLDGFLSFVKKKYPSVIKTEHISKFAFDTIFLDISSYIYKYICIFGNSNPQWITSIMQMFLTLKGNKVNVIPIFDGKPPEAKQGEINERKEKRNKLKNKMSSIQDCITKLTEGESLTEEERKFVFEILKKQREKEEPTKLKRLLKISSKTDDVIIKNEFGEDDYVFTSEDINDLQNCNNTLQKQMVYIGDKDTVILKDLLNILGIPFVVAPEEAEAFCCSMLKQGIGKGVISCDTDCFAHGAQIVITTFEALTGDITMVSLEEMLNEMELNHTEFVDFGILIGCDYNVKNKLPKVGPVKALELIKKYKSIDNIEGYDISKLNHQDIRKLFNPQYKKIKKIAHKKIDEDALYEFIEEHNLRIGRNKIEGALKIINEKPKIIFQSSDEENEEDEDDEETN